MKRSHELRREVLPPRKSQTSGWWDGWWGGSGSGSVPHAAAPIYKTIFVAILVIMSLAIARLAVYFGDEDDRRRLDAVEIRDLGQ